MRQRNKIRFTTKNEGDCVDRNCKHTMECVSNTGNGIFHYVCDWCDSRCLGDIRYTCNVSERCNIDLCEECVNTEPLHLELLKHVNINR